MATPIPSFPQIQSTDLGEGECDEFMDTLTSAKVNALPAHAFGRLQSQREAISQMGTMSARVVRSRSAGKLHEFCRGENL